MWALAIAIAVGLVGACGGNSQAVTRDPDFCCTADRCCGVRYYDVDGGVHMQRCSSWADAGRGGSLE